jgi:flagellar basal body-associated protein FliL
VAEDARRPREPAAVSPPAERPGDAPKRKMALKPIFVVLIAFVLQVAVVFLVFFLAGKGYSASAGAGSGEGASGSGGHGASPEAAPAGPGAALVTVDLGTVPVTNFQKGDPINRHQLQVAIAVSLKKEEGEPIHQRRLEAQKAWISQLLDEVLGKIPLDALHPSNREPLKRQLRASINERLGDDIVQEVILRIQIYGT